MAHPSRRPKPSRGAAAAPPGLHDLLLRQLQDCFRDREPPPECASLIAAVDASYRRFQLERDMLDRALQLASKELVKTTTETRALLAAFPDLFLWIDARNVITNVHAGRNDELLVSAERLIGRKLHAVPDRVTSERLEQAAIDARTSGEMITTEYDLEVDSGPQTYEARLVPLVEDQILVVIRNVTERKAIERETARARDRAEALARAKTEFLATMSHEIRTPLNAVIGLTSLLAETELSDEQREFVETMRVSGEALLTLVNDVLDYSKLEAGRVEIESVELDLHRLLRDSLSLVADNAREQGTELVTSLDPAVPQQVRGDPTRLRQVLLNLLGNAVKFTRNGRVELRADVAAARGDRFELRVEVRDNGVGVPDAARARMFAPFSQADSSTTRQFGGTGLGLAICKRITDSWGGRIDYESTPGKGSRFWFTVPLERCPPPAAAPAPAAAKTVEPGTQRGRVLLAEDNPVNQMVASRMLQRLGYEVDIVDNGADALSSVQNAAYDVVLMDCQMPVMDGYDATREIRRAEAERGADPVPIVALTANAMQGDRSRCSDAGMDDFLSKPVRQEQLAATLERWTARE